jgi:hypothetical protein
MRSPPNQPRAAGRTARVPGHMDAFAKRTLLYTGVLATPLVSGVLLARAALVLIG